MRLHRLFSPLLLAVLAPLGAAQCLEWDSGIPPAGLGPNNTVRDMIVWDDGTGPALYVCGSFTSIAGVPANRIAKWDGSSWSALGQGLEGASSICIRMFPWSIAGSPVLVAGGTFTLAGGSTANRIAIWDGTQWSSLGIGLTNGAVWDFELFDAGSGPELYACGSFTSSGPTSVVRVARWDGSQWLPLGPGLSGMGNRAVVMEVYDEGSGPRLFVGGAFTNAGGLFVGCFARWDGASWSAVGSGVQQTSSVEGVFDLEILDMGGGPKLCASGWFATPGFILHSFALWDGASYQFFNTQIDGQVRGMSVFDDGTGTAVFLGGNLILIGGPPANDMVKWNGQAFTTLGAGISSGSVERLRVLPDLSGGADDLWVGGTFTNAGGTPTINLARWKGCDGPGVMICAGDVKSAVPCPCANLGSPSHGCENSASTGGALLSSSGTTNPDTVVLLAQNELATALTIFLQGDVIGAPVSFGDGLRCAAGNLLRLYVTNAVNGTASAPSPTDPGIVARAAQLGDVIGPGSVRLYQAYYRDADPVFCPDTSGGNTWNASNGVRIDW